MRIWSFALLALVLSVSGALACAVGIDRSGLRAVFIGDLVAQEGAYLEFRVHATLQGEVRPNWRVRQGPQSTGPGGVSKGRLVVVALAGEAPALASAPCSRGAVLYPVLSPDGLAVLAAAGADLRLPN